MPPNYLNNQNVNIFNNQTIKTDSDDDYNETYLNDEPDNNSINDQQQQNSNDIKFVSVQRIPARPLTINNVVTSFHDDNDDHFSKFSKSKIFSKKKY